MKTLVDTENWVPVGNNLMLKAAYINEPKNEIEKISSSKDCYEVIGFGSAYKGSVLDPILTIDDKVLIVENSNERSHGTQVTIGTEIIWFYPPSSVAVILHKEDNEYKIIPVGDFLLLKRKESEKKIGSIYIPESAETKSTHATVAMLGTGVNAESKKNDFEVSVGDTVLISKHSNNEIEINGETWLLVKNSEVLAKSVEAK